MKLTFADCILNTDSRQLTRRGAAVPLEPKMYALLEVLIARRPSVVTYAELDELLWPKVYVARTSLTRLVSELRAALGDSPGGATIIRTASKTGYAFAAEVFCDAQGQRTATAFSLCADGRSLPLFEGENIAGRTADCALMVDAPTVSRRHARFTIVAGAARVEDLGSTNGTFVNGAAITASTPLADGDEIALGRESFKLRVVAAPPPTEMMTRDTLMRAAGDSRAAGDPAGPGER